MYSWSFLECLTAGDQRSRPLYDPQGERNVAPQRGEVSVGRKQEGPGVARRERNQAVVLESGQSHSFVIRKDLRQEPTTVSYQQRRQDGGSKGTS